MLSFLAAALLSSNLASSPSPKPRSNQTETIQLYRGAALASGLPRYWEVEDTTLDSTAADLNQGGQTELDGGPGKTILIQFQGLNRALGPNMKVVGASLVFTLMTGKQLVLTEVRGVLVPWNQGPIKTISEKNPDNPQQPGALRSATWRHRRLGGASWEHVGATGDRDSAPVSGAKLTSPDADHIQIDGLADAVEEQYEHPQANHGFVLVFSSPVSLVSSEASQDRPKLVLQVESAVPKSGPDLTVAYIERKPEYQRYENEVGVTVQNQDGAPVPVLDRPTNALTKKWPSENEDLLYIAHIKNVGDAPAQGFTATWYDNENPGAPDDVSQTVAPGQEATVELHLPFRNTPIDHRLQPIAIRIDPKGADSNPSDKFLEINQSALNLGVFVEKSFYQKLGSQQDWFGAHSFDSWIQGQVWLLNHVYFPFSRFSFAPDGVTERLRIQRITVVPDGSLQGPLALPDGKADLTYDAEVGFRATDPTPSSAGADISLLKALCVQLGLVDFGAVTFPSGDSRLASLVQDGTTPRGIEDLFPGLMGGGDTRDEALLPPSIRLPYQPYPDEEIQLVDLPPTDLLCAADVAELQSDLGKRRGFQGDALYDTPAITFLTIVDYSGQKIANADLTFYQMVNGSFPANARALKLKSNEDGVVTLFKRDILAGASDPVVTGHELKPNPFGRIDYRGLNDTFIVRASLNGAVEWAPLKLWELTDSVHRGQQAVFLNIAFNLASGALDESTDFAAGKTFTSSAGSSLSFAGNEEISLPEDSGAWIDVDLGRDRTIGEVRLLSESSQFWKNFEFRTYQTGEKASDSQFWTQEGNWDWSRQNRADLSADLPGVVSVAYRGPARRFRYLRIINKGPATSAKLLKISVVPLKAAAGPTG